MTLLSWAKKELLRLGIDKSSQRRLLPQRSHNSVESTATPQVQEVVLAADLRCGKCQKRVADIISKIDGMPKITVIGLSVSEIQAVKHYIDMDSMVVHVLEKKVTITRKSVGGGLSRKVPGIYKVSI